MAPWATITVGPVIRPTNGAPLLPVGVAFAVPRSPVIAVDRRLG